MFKYACNGTDVENHRKKLVEILRAAYSGEMGAAFAYRGHWQSVTEPDEIREIRRVEAEEWAHRADIRGMLADLGAKPQIIREVFLWLVGRTAGRLCLIAGWFFPMYVAGMLETENVDEYTRAANHAGSLGMEALQRDLLEMTQTEKRHEAFFFRMVAGHPLLPAARSIMGWGPGRAQNSGKEYLI